MKPTWGVNDYRFTRPLLPRFTCGQTRLPHSQPGALAGDPGLLVAVPPAVGKSAGIAVVGWLVPRRLAALLLHFDEPFRRLLFRPLVRAVVGAGLLHFGGLAARLPRRKQLIARMT